MGFGGEPKISDDSKSLIYSPQAEQYRSPWFTYSVQGVDGQISTNSVYLDVVSRVEVRGDVFEVDLNARDLRLDILANDRVNDPTANPTIVAIDQPAVGGVFSIADDGKSLVFTATPGFLGVASATYSVRTGPGENDVVQSHVRIDIVRPFFAIDDFFVVDPANQVTSLDVLANESIQTHWRSIHGQNRNLRIVNVTPGSQGGQVSIAAY